MDEKYTGCRSDLHTTQENIEHLSEVKGTCLETLKHVSETMELLSSAFSSKHSLSQNISFELAESRKAARIMKKDLSTREESLSQLKLENKELKNQIMKLNSSLTHVNGDKIVLEDKLGTIQQDMDGLKSNTSRLLGENAGLEKVLNVKAELEDHKIEAAEQVLDLASKKGIKKIKIITDDEDNEEDSTSNETMENVTKEIEKVVEKNIRKMAKSDKEKLKPILDVLSKTSMPSTKSSLKANDNLVDQLLEPDEEKSEDSIKTKLKNGSQLLILKRPVHLKKHDKLSQKLGIEFPEIEKDNRTPNVIKENVLDLQLSTTNNKSKDGEEQSSISKNNATNLVLDTTSAPRIDVNEGPRVNNNKLDEIHAEMKNTKKKINKLQKFGEILKNASVEKSPNKVSGGGGDVFADKENNDHGAINAKEASHQIAKIVKELPNLVKI